MAAPIPQYDQLPADGAPDAPDPNADTGDTTAADNAPPPGLLPGDQGATTDVTAAPAPPPPSALDPSANPGDPNQNADNFWTNLQTAYSQYANAIGARPQEEPYDLAQSGYGDPYVQQVMGSGEQYPQMQGMDPYPYAPQQSDQSSGPTGYDYAGAEGMAPGGGGYAQSPYPDYSPVQPSGFGQDQSASFDPYPTDQGSAQQGNQFDHIFSQHPGPLSN